MSNFTWADIYAPYARDLGGEALRLVADLRSDYRHATALFRMQPALKMAWLKPAIDVGMVVNQGATAGRSWCVPSAWCAARPGRLFLRRALWAGGPRLVAAGAAGRARDPFRRLRPAPGGGPRNLHVIPSPAWPGGDLIASTDAAVAKAGYSTACEAMASGTPMIYPPRRGFAEFRSLDRALRDWAGGVPISSRDFQGLRLEQRAGTGPLGRARPAAVPGRRRRADRSAPRGRLPGSRRGTRTGRRPSHEAGDPSGRRARAIRRTPGRGPRGRVGQRRRRIPGDRGHARRRRPARQDHARDARGRRSPALGADLHGQPGTLHVPRAGGASLRHDQHRAASSAT